MAKLLPWDQASASPKYQNASPEVQAQMRDQYTKAGGVIPSATASAPEAAPSSSQQGDWASDAGNFLGSAGSAAVQSVGRGIQRIGHGIQEIGAPVVNTLTGSQAYTNADEAALQKAEETSKTAYSQRMDSLSSQAGRKTGEFLGNTAVGIAEFSNPLIAGIAETGGAYADQAPEDKSLFRAGEVGLAGAITSKLLPKGVPEGGLLGTAKTLGKAAGYGGAGAGLMGMASEESQSGGRATTEDLISSGLRAVPEGMLFGAGFTGVHMAGAKVLGKVAESPVVDKAPEEVKTSIGDQANTVGEAQTAADRRAAYSKSDDLVTAKSLSAMDDLGFRINDAAVRDDAAGQRILGTTQEKAQKSFVNAEKTNASPLFGGVTPRAGKLNADLEHNQRIGEDFVSSQKDIMDTNVDALQSHLDEIKEQLENTKSEGGFVGSNNDYKVVTRNDQHLLDSYKEWAKDASTMKARGENDMSSFLDKSETLHNAYENASPEAQAIVDKFQKAKGFDEGFDPIGDAHQLNKMSHMLEKQDRGWSSITAEGTKTKESPLKNPFSAKGWLEYAGGKLKASDRIRARAKEQARNAGTIRDLAAADLNVAKARRSMDVAREEMESQPVEDPIPFKEEPAAQPAPEATVTPRDTLSSRLLARAQLLAEARDRAAQARSEPLQETVPEQPTGPAPADLTAAARNEAAVAQHRADLERARQEAHGTEEAPAEPIPEATEPRGISAQELADVGRRVREVRKPTEESAPVEEATPQETTPEPERPRSFTAQELAEVGRRVRETQKPEPTVEEAPVQEEAPAPKAEPLPIPKEKPAAAPEAKSESLGGKLVKALSPAVRKIHELRMNRFAKTLATPEVRAKATLENMYSSNKHYKEFLKDLAAEDKLANTERFEEAARRQLEASDKLKAAKNEVIRGQFSEWLKGRDIPSDIVNEAIRKEEKGEGGNVGSLDALMKRVTTLNQKRLDAEYAKMVDEAYAEDKKLFPDQKGPTIENQKADLNKQLDELLAEESMSPEQKDAVKKMLTEHINDKFRAAEKAGREEGMETGQMRDIWEGFFNEYKRQSSTFLKANKNNQYQMAADAISAREKRFEEAKAKRAATLEARAKVEADKVTTRGISEQRAEIEKMLDELPKDIQETQRRRVIRQMEVHHNRGRMVAPERYRNMIESITNAETAHLDKQARTTQEEKDAAIERHDRMMEAAIEMDRKFEAAKRAEERDKTKEALEKQNDLTAVQRQRDDIRARLEKQFEGTEVPEDKAKEFIDSYMDNRYSLLEKPMSPADYQNARARIERDAGAFSKGFKDMSAAEQDVAAATGTTEGVTPETHGEKVSKAVEDVKATEADVKKLQEEEINLNKERASMPADEKADAQEAITEAMKKAQDDFISKVEEAFKNNRNLDQLAKVAEIMDRVHGADLTGNNRRFVNVLKTAAKNKEKYGDNPAAWISSEDYIDIAKIGSGTAGGNKSRALVKIFRTTEGEAKAKLLGPDAVAKLRQVIKKNPNAKIPKYDTSTRVDYAKFLEGFDEMGNRKQLGSLREASQKAKLPKTLRVSPRKLD